MTKPMPILGFALLALSFAPALLAQAERCASSLPASCTCGNEPYAPTDCWTSDYGPAAADVVTGATNFLYCDSGNYALCFFSGPPYPTGKDSDTNPALPCTLSDDGTTADCACEAFTASADRPYYVAITSILNLGVYYETVAACGEDGSSCFNLANRCTGSDDDDAGDDDEDSDCDDMQMAPVCAYLAGQSSTDPSTSLIPGADLISAFSFAMSAPGGAYTVGSTGCEGDDAGLYAGCMTAPCKYPDGVTAPSKDPENPTLVQCSCPTYLGNYQVGQAKRTLEEAMIRARAEGDVCHPGTQDGAFYVWSAANTVGSTGLGG